MNQVLKTCDQSMCTSNFLCTGERSIDCRLRRVASGTNFLRMCNKAFFPHAALSDLAATTLPAQKRGTLTKGCQLCMSGKKLPVYITMQCNQRCYYCPIDPRLLASDICVVRGRIITRMDSVLEMCGDSVAGVSVSGGEPLLKIDETLDLIRLLKLKKGQAFHIHLYTNGSLITPTIVAELERAGLDEIRPSTLDIDTLKVISQSSLTVTLETVALRERSEMIKTTLARIVDFGISNLVLTEAEINTFNEDRILVRDSTLGAGQQCESRDSLMVAMEIRDWVENRDLPINVHICSRQNAYLSAFRREEHLNTTGVPGTIRDVTQLAPLA